MPTVIMKKTPADSAKPAKTSTKGDKLDGLRSTTVNPITVIVAALVLVAALCWFLWLGPKQAADKAARDWTTPEAAAARAPGGQAKDANHEATVQRLRAKEGGAERAHGSRRDD